ncbi:MAG: hypothetical protein IJU12_11700 [Clostridia bacterium]|nr:hypothetical protein [Clostridia bacterium]
MSYVLWLYIIGAICVVTGILMMMGKAKFFSSFSWGRNNGKPKSEKYVKMDGAISTATGALVIVAGLLIQNGVSTAGYILLAATVIAAVCGTIYVEKKFRNV